MSSVSHQNVRSQRTETSGQPAAAARRRRWPLLAVLTAGALVAVSCGSDDDSGASSDEPSTTSAGSDTAIATDTTSDSSTTDTDTDTTTSPNGADAQDGDSFPVEFSHKYGSTTIEERPERVVTVGLTDQDSVLALGVAPVGINDWFGDHPHAVWPWGQDELGDAEPKIVGNSEGINFEKIAGLRPNVILAVYSGITQDEYDILSEIAPTVAQPDEYVDWGIPWQEQTITIGQALGLRDDAEALVAEVEETFATARDEHPEFEGATAIVATPWQGTVSVFAPEDPRGRFIDALGFQFPDEIAELTGDDFYAELSLEQAELIDVDVIVWILDDVEADMDRLHQEPVYARLDVVSEGREVAVANLSDLGGATSFQTVLSLPTLIDGVVPMLAAAVDGDPETVVPPDN